MLRRRRGKIAALSAITSATFEEPVELGETDFAPPKLFLVADTGSRFSPAWRKTKPAIVGVGMAAAILLMVFMGW